MSKKRESIKDDPNDYKIAPVLAIDLQKFSSAEEMEAEKLVDEMFLKGVIDNDEIPEMRWAYVHKDYATLKMSKNFTRDSAFVYKLDITARQLRDSAQMEFEKLEANPPIYGTCYNCHTLVHNILENIH